MLLLHEDENIAVWMEWYPMFDAWGLHTEVRKFSKDKLKQWRQMFQEFLNHMKTKGITKFIAIPPTEKEEKWQRLFGFVDSGFRLNTTIKVLELK